MKLWVWLILFSIGCVDHRIAEEELELDLYYSSVSICSCHKSGVEVLSALIKDDQQLYKTLFQELRMNCLTKYGTQLFVPSHCNNPDEIGELVDSLYSMGIDINDGS